MNGGNVFTTGLTYSIDKRNNIFYPNQGILFNFVSEFSSSQFLSDFNFSIFQISLSKYKELKENHILVLNLTTGTTVGDAPFL